MIALIVAYDKNRAIGNKGVIPWNIPGEKKRFKELTTGNVVIMGRKTFEEIGRPLSGRTTIVVSSTKNFDGENCHTVNNFDEAIKLAGERDIYISGGERIYREAIPYVKRMYITEIDANYGGDAFFPEVDMDKFELVEEKVICGKVPYKYLTYERK